ncbi:NAD(P)H-dependent glycerol-3-phosphate dehydrogenase [Elusimicrobiota bacterium]
MDKKKNRYKIGILGAGSWGLTLANVLFDNNNDVVIWEFDPKQCDKLSKERRFYPLGDYRIPDELVITNSLSEAVSSKDYIIFSLPSSTIRTVTEKISHLKFPVDPVIISTVKGFDHKSLKRPSEILRMNLGKRRKIAVLSGPSHAEEVIKRIPTAVVAASVNRDVNTAIQTLFSNIYFRVYTTSDIKGVELGGALKNIIAISSGIAKGLNLGDNTRAALVTRGNAELMRLGLKLGAKKATFNGLSGIGDLVVTCFSDHSRNFKFGRLIGQGYNMKEALKIIKVTVEGVGASECCYRISKKNYIQMPLCNMVYEILFKGKNPQKACQELMMRPLKSET